MKDTESYVNKAEVKRKIRAWLKYRQSSKQVTDELLGLIEKLPVTVKVQLEVTLESNWISVKDRLPELYMDVLVFAKGGIIDVDCLEHIMSWGEEGFCKYGYNVTHWMPLPQMPESEDDEE